SQPFRRHPCGLFPAVDFPGAEAATTRFSRPGERCTSHKTFCRRRQKLLRLPPDNCPVPWQSLPHRKGPLRGETPKKWTAEGAFAPPGNNRSARRPDSAEGDFFMTVSSTISVFCRDGVFRTVYCHLHGEPVRNGRILHTHYATGQQAEALVEHGDIRCLGPRCDKPAGHTLQNPVDGVTAY